VVIRREDEAPPLEEDSLTPERKNMAYKDMNYMIYIFVTVLLYICEITCAIVMDDIGVIFEFVSAISVSCLCFIFPGMFFILAANKFLPSELQD